MRPATHIVFMGTPDFAVPSLDILLRHSYHVVSVVTAPDKPRGRGQELSPTPVKEAALRHGLAVSQPVSLKDPAFAAELAALNPDLIVVVAFRILPREVFAIPRLGSFNLHASLLPKYRGAAPINWAIMNGDAITGVTSFFLEEKVDTGGMILQVGVPITPDDDAGSLHDKLAVVGAAVVLDTVRLIEAGKAVPQPQDNVLATPAPKIFKEDCKIRWDLPAVKIRNTIRGLSPYPTAYTLLGGKVVKIFRSHIAGAKAAWSPGELTVSPSSLEVSTQDFRLAIDELQIEGRKRMGAEEFLRGHKIVSGERFE
jgi:methionyl-tRNA formyltransferase